MLIRKNKNHVSLLYSGHQFDYLYGILSGFYKTNRYYIDVIDGDRPADEKHGFYNDPYFHFRSVLGNRRKTNIGKILRWVVYYLRLIPYLLFNKSSIIHIEWLNSQFVGFEEIILPIIIKKIRGQKLVYKVHDISSRLLLQKPGKSYQINLNFTKKFFYNNVDVFIVHNSFTKKLLTDFGISAEKVKIIRHGVNNFVPFSNKSKSETRRQIGLKNEDKVILFFGNISPYKNIENLIDAVAELKKTHKNIVLLIAGNFRKGLEKYKKEIEAKLNNEFVKDNIVLHLEFIGSEDVENYFAAADVLCLPYKFIFQSGVLFLAYTLGTFVIARKVGGIPEDIMEGETGLTYDKDEDLSKVLTTFFSSEQYHDKNLDEKIRNYANENYSWQKLSGQLLEVYNEMIESE
jgi:glycosyltransferase involved in cell wall biosynthesis